MKLIDGREYSTIDHRTVRLEKTASGTFYDRGTNRYFTPAGHCIAYYRGDEAIIEKNRSIVGCDDLDPEEQIVAEIMNDEAKAQADQHTWLSVTSKSPQLMTIDYAWCRDCGALKVTTIAGCREKVEIRTPTDYHTCGTNKSKKPART